MNEYVIQTPDETLALGLALGEHCFNDLDWKDQVMFHSGMIAGLTLFRVSPEYAMAIELAELTPEGEETFRSVMAACPIRRVSE